MWGICPLSPVSIDFFLSSLCPPLLHRSLNLASCFCFPHSFLTVPDIIDASACLSTCLSGYFSLYLVTSHSIRLLFSLYIRLHAHLRRVCYCDRGIVSGDDDGGDGELFYPTQCRLPTGISSISFLILFCFLFITHDLNDICPSCLFYFIFLPQISIPSRVGGRSIDWLRTGRPDWVSAVGSALA